MARAKRKTSSLNFYHVIQVGDKRANIFFDNSDRLCFLEILKVATGYNNVRVHGYCLMDNHVHLLLQASSIGLLTNAMMRLFRNYSGYFNKRYNRIGTLYDNNFWSDPIEDWQRFKECLSYILRNPIEIGDQNFLNYKWSSVNHYHSEIDSVVDKRLIRNLYKTKEKFHAHLCKKSDIYKVKKSYDPTHRESVYDRDAASIRRIVKFIRNRYNIYTPLELSVERKCELIEEIRRIMPDIPITIVAKCFKISRTTIYRKHQ